MNYLKSIWSMPSGQKISLLAKALVGLLVIGSVCFAPREVYFAPWSWTYAFIILLIVVALWQRHGCILAMNFFVWTSGPLFAYIDSPFAHDQHLALLSMKTITQDAVIAALLFTLFTTLYKNFLVAVRHAFCIAWFLEFVSLLLPRSVLGFDGFLGNTSIGACFLSVVLWMLPTRIILNFEKELRVPIRVPALFATVVLLAFLHSATAWMALGISFSVLTFIQFPKYKWSALVPALFCLVTLMYVKSNIFGHFDRYDLWQMAMKDWWDNASIWFGYGHGTYKYMGPQAQLASGFMGNGPTKEIYLWLHSDILQLLFEGGVVGMAWALALYLQLIYKFYTRELEVYLAATIALGVVMLTQYPLELPSFALFGCFLLMKAYGSPALPIYNPPKQGSWV